MSSGAIALVDPYSSGAALGELLLDEGACVIWVKSQTVEPHNLSIPKNANRYALILDGEQLGYDEIVRKLRVFGVQSVLLGTDSPYGGRLADKLAKDLGLPGNNPSTSDLRRDKYKMQQSLSRRGLRHISTNLVGNASEIERALRAIPAPYVVKPVRSAGTDGVSLCHTQSEAKVAASSLLGAKNAFGEINSQIIIQEFIEGSEFVVDGISQGGQHQFCALWEYKKVQIEGAIVYRSMELMPYDGNTQDELRNYCAKALDALEVSHGPSHSEIIMTNKGPVLIETGARLHGGMGCRFAEPATGNSQLRLTANLCLNLMRPDRCFAYSVTGRAIEIFLINPRSGRLATLEGVERLRRLPSYLADTVQADVGQPLEKTKDLFTSPGSAILFHRDKTRVARDIETVISWEREGSLLPLM